MAVALGQHTSAQATFASTVTTGTLNTSPSGSTFLLFCFGTPAVTFSDNKGNTYTAGQSQQYNGTFRTGQWAYVQNGAGGSGHTFTATGGSNAALLIFAIELTGAATSGGPLNTTTPATGSTAAANAASITPSASDSAVINGAGWSAAGTVTSGGGAFTLLDQQSDASFGNSAAVSLAIVGAPAATADTLTNSAANPWAAFSVAFGSAATAPTINTQPTSQVQKVNTQATFTVAVSFPGTGPSYQWKVDTGSGYVNVGTNSATYTTQALQLVNAGNVKCTASDSSGSTDSNVVTLTVYDRGPDTYTPKRRRKAATVFNTSVSSWWR